MHGDMLISAGTKLYIDVGQRGGDGGLLTPGGGGGTFVLDAAKNPIAVAGRGVGSGYDESTEQAPSGYMTDAQKLSAGQGGGGSRETTHSSPVVRAAVARASMPTATTARAIATLRSPSPHVRSVEPTAVSRMRTASSAATAVPDSRTWITAARAASAAVAARVTPCTQAAAAEVAVMPVDAAGQAAGDIPAQTTLRIRDHQPRALTRCSKRGDDTSVDAKHAR